MGIIKVGILGTGFGLVHAEHYRAIEGVQVKSIFGRKPDKLEEVKEKFGVEVTTDPYQLIEDPEIDLIDVCLPTRVHLEYVTAALEKGKNVFCETPLAYSLQEAQKMQHYSRKFKRKLFVNLFFKYSPPHKMALDLIRSGKLGTPRSVTTYNRTPSFWENVGIEDIVLNFALHNFDFLVELLGIPNHVTARGIGNDNTAHVVATLNYLDSMASVDCSSMVPHGYPFSIGYNIVCSRGTINYAGEFGDRPQEKTTIYHQDGNIEEITPKRDDENKLVLEKVCSAIRQNLPCPDLSIDAAIKSLKIGLACNKALQNNCAVEI